jgi:ABC-type multidrug transport system, ATPase and permease components
MRATEELMRGRTTFMIAHRLSTLRLCDMVVRLEQGRVVEISHRVTTELVPGVQSAATKTLLLQ